ncbi:MAG: type II secretion system protein GspG [Opitutaceae bacterium]
MLKERQAKADVERFKTGLLPYRLDVGSYPFTSEGLDALMQPPEGAESKRQRLCDLALFA